MRFNNAIAFCFTILFGAAGYGQEMEVTVREYKKIFTTYPFSDPNPIPDPQSKIYPYTFFDGYTNIPVQKEWKVVEIENQYIKVIILPEIGGKIWTAIEKSTDRPFIYNNHVVKFRNLGIRGPYTSGGIESNFGIIGHTANVATPIDYVIKKYDDGSASCIIGTLDLLTRTTWRTAINLPRDKACFTTETIWHNNTSIEQPYYHWLNAGMPVKGNVEFLYPGSAYIDHDGTVGDWPVNRTNKKHINFYENNDFGGPKSYHVAGKYADYWGAYWHDYNFGMIRYGARDGKAGKKLWIWGLSDQGMIWEQLLTDKDGQYWELQSGRQFNQNAEASVLSPFKHTAFTPYGTDMWKEYWYPILRTEGAREANEYGALNFKYENGWLKIYFSAVQHIDDYLELKDDSETIYRRKILLAPMQVFYDSVKVKLPAASWKAVLGENKLVHSFDSTTGNLGRPLKAPENFNWNSQYGQYLLGKSFMDQKKFPEAMEKFTASLQLDPGYLPALVASSELMYRNMRYPESLEYARKALSIDAHSGAANYFYGVANKQLKNFTDAKDGFELAALTAEYRSAAYTELAAIYLHDHMLDRAVAYAIKATDFNRHNITALRYAAIAYRLMKNITKANEMLAVISGFEGLSHFVNFEKYISAGTADSKKQFTGLITGETAQEEYNELGIFYYGIGCVAEAEQLFSMALPSAEAGYWLGYLQKKPVDFAEMSKATFLPFRSETAGVMERLLSSCNSWQLKYHLALVYANRNRLREARELLGKCGHEPDIAAFYAFRAAMSENSESRLADLKKALDIDKSWRYYALLTNYYMEKMQPSDALALTLRYYEQHPKDPAAGFYLAKLYLKTGAFGKADELLGKINLLPAEGSTEVYDTYREIQLMLAVEQMKAGKFALALRYITLAMKYPQKFGVGALYENETDYRLEEWMSYLCYRQMAKNKKAAEMLSKIIDYTPRPAVWGALSMANHLITALAYDRLSKHDHALYFILNESKHTPALTEVYQSLFEEKEPRFNLIEQSTTVRVLEQLYKIRSMK